MRTTQQNSTRPAIAHAAWIILVALALVAPPAASQTPGGGVDVPLGGLYDSAVAINPLDPNNLAVAVWDIGGQWLRVSTDGGATFSAPTYPSVPQHTGGGLPVDCV
jgi:hypothetical protein